MAVGTFNRERLIELLRVICPRWRAQTGEGFPHPKQPGRTLLQFRNGWLAKRPRHREVLCLPGYSPFDPDERLNIVLHRG